jgi:hypothetical protein
MTRPGHVWNSDCTLSGATDRHVDHNHVSVFCIHASCWRESIETVIYRGAYHAWTVSSLTMLRFYPEYVRTKKCPLILLGPNRLVFLIDAQPNPFDASTIGVCVAQASGFSTACDASVRALFFGEICNLGALLVVRPQPVAFYCPWGKGRE